MTDTSVNSRPSILLCDDSNVERSAVARWLATEEYHVHEAVDGRSALRILRDERVDLVLLDLNMPQIDGFGVLDYIQEHRRALPVVLLSGMPPDRIQHGIAKLRSHELPPLLLKPLDPDQLLSVIALGLEGALDVEKQDA